MSDEKRDMLGYAITGKEFVAMDDLARFGIEHWRGTQVKFERRGKQRTAEPHEYPALHNYIWLRPTNAQMPYLAKARFLGGTFHWLSNAAIRQLAAFRERIDAKLQEAKRIEGNRKAIADYAAFKPGELLEIREGPLAGEMARFSALVQKSQDLFPIIKAEMDLMGRVVPVKLDPLDVRRATTA